MDYQLFKFKIELPENSSRMKTKEIFNQIEKQLSDPNLSFNTTPNSLVCTNNKVMRRKGDPLSNVTQFSFEEERAIQRQIVVKLRMSVLIPAMLVVGLIPFAFIFATDTFPLPPFFLIIFVANIPILYLAFLFKYQRYFKKLISGLQPEDE